MQKILTVGLALLLWANSALAAEAKDVAQQPLQATVMKSSMKDKEYASGVAAPFGGILGNKLIVAGGYNYPGNILGKPNAKKFYKDVYAAVLKPKAKKLQWQKVAELPMELASGVTLAAPDALYFIGGTNQGGDRAVCVELKPQGEGFHCEVISYLPVLASNLAGGYMDDCLYIVGGLQNGKPSRDLYRMQLKGDRSKWQKLAPLPETPRIQPVAAVQKDKSGKNMLYVWGGFDGWSPSSILQCGGCKYDPQKNSWTQLGAPLKDEKRVYLGGGGAAPLGEDRIAVWGGFDYAQLLASIRQPAPEDGKHEPAWYKYNHEVYAYNTRTDKWQCLGALTAPGTVHSAVTGSGNCLYSLHGELKPGTNTGLVLCVELQP